MFCPGCGSEERQASQYCRACGTDLRAVRVSLERPDSVTASAVSAREEIGRAVAAKIREVHDAKELKKVAEDVLPQIEKFLESPEEKRLRRMRIGTTVSTIGLGVAISLGLVAAASGKEELLLFAGLGFITVFVGLGFILNGIFLTVPKMSLPDRSSDADSQRRLDGLVGNTNELRLPEPASLFSSVTEHTTRHLENKEPSIKR